MQPFKLLMGAVAVAAAATMVIPSSPATAAASNTVTYTGQGLTADGFGGYDLNTELCGVVNGANVDGPYLLFVLTATGATTANITIGAATSAMTKSGGGSFKYISGWLDPSHLPTITASYDGKAKNAQLVISHGCRPFTQGAWCSPGFWRNADVAAWALTGYNRSDLFNTTAYPLWYGAMFAATPTLQTVLTNPPTYSGPPLAGTSGYALNAFNATGAMLTDALPGYSFELAVMQAGGSDACPIDSHGNFKLPTVDNLPTD